MKKIFISVILGLNVIGFCYAQSTSDENGVIIEYIAHAAFVLTSPDGTKIIIDPYASNVWIGYDFPEIPGVDAIVVTHPHYDHDGGQYRGRQPDWQKELPSFQQIGHYQIGDIKLTGVPGKHSDPYGREFGQKNIIWVIEAGGLRIAHLGDNGPITDSIRHAIGKVDILMLPADGDQHILKNDEVLDFINALEPKIQIPMHYCLPELEKTGNCPGGLLPVINPPVSGAQVKMVGNGVRLKSGDLPQKSEYWIFEPSELIMRSTK